MGDLLVWVEIFTSCTEIVCIIIVWFFHLEILINQELHFLLFIHLSSRSLALPRPPEQVLAYLTLCWLPAGTWGSPWSIAELHRAKVIPHRVALLIKLIFSISYLKFESGLHMLQNRIIIRLFLIHTVKNNAFIQLFERLLFVGVLLGSSAGRDVLAALYCATSNGHRSWHIRHFK